MISYDEFEEIVVKILKRDISSSSSVGTEVMFISSSSVSVTCHTAISALLSNFFLKYSAINA